LDTYMDELKKFPDTRKKLKTNKGDAFFQKMDIFANKLWYSYQDNPYEFIEMSLKRVNEIIELNKKDEKVKELKDVTIVVEITPDYANVVGQDSLTRFDNKGSKKSNKNKGNRNKKKGGGAPNKVIKKSTNS